MVKRSVEKSPVKWMAWCDELVRMKKTLPDADFQTWLTKQRHWCHEAHPGQVCHDKVKRLPSLFSYPSARKYVHLLPWTGWGTLREIPKLITCDSDLEDLILSGRINPTTTRKEVDDMRRAKQLSCGMKPTRPRHVRPSY